MTNVSIKFKAWVIIIALSVHVPIVLLAMTVADLNAQVSYQARTIIMMADALAVNTDIDSSQTDALMALDGSVSDFNNILEAGDIVRIIKAPTPDLPVTTPTPIPTPTTEAEPTVDYLALNTCLAQYTLGLTPPEGLNCPDAVETVKMTAGNIYAMPYEFKLNCLESDIQGLRNVSICPSDSIAFVWGDSREIPSKTLRRLQDSCLIAQTRNVYQPVCEEILSK